MAHFDAHLELQMCIFLGLEQRTELHKIRPHYETRLGLHVKMELERNLPANLPSKLRGKTSSRREKYERKR